MCGFSGAINFNGGTIDWKSLQRMNSSIRHRGPDDEGYLFINTESGSFFPASGDDTIAEKKNEYSHLSAVHPGNLGFGFRRLSIIDITANGHQPMFDPESQTAVVFNGEIYNYLEIRKVLESKGYKFKSNTDTEVILKAYAEWKEDAVKHFNGMWAIAIYDGNSKKLLLSRDRMGVKPLYYCEKNGQLIFASEIKGILEYTNEKFKINQNKVNEFFVRGQVVVGDSDDTMFEGIKQLIPGHHLLIDIKNKGSKLLKFWELKINMLPGSVEEHTEKFRELLKDSVRLRLRSDVEVGTCLSGGLDSSSIVGLVSEISSKPVNTFSAVWPGTEHDETRYIKSVNTKFNCRENLINPVIGEDLYDLINKITWHQEIPLPGSSLMAQWFVMKKAREKNVPVLLDGQGADEILSGYPAYIPAYLNELIYHFKWKYLLKNKSDWEYFGYDFEKIAKLQYNKLFYKPAPRLPVNSEDAKKYRWHYKYRTASECNFLPDFLKEHIEKTNLPTLLHFEDRNSMAFSIEARVPFLDYRLVEYAVNIPSEKKFKGALTKVILREALKNVLPEDVYNRRDKIGFSTPIEKTIIRDHAGIKNHMLEEVRNSSLWKSGYIDQALFREEHIFPVYSMVSFLNVFKNSIQ